MYTLSFLLSFFSVWSLFSTASKVEYEKVNVSKYLSQNAMVARVAAVVLFLLSTIALCYVKGNAVGILFSFLVWMTLASIILLLVPFDKISWKHISIVALISLTLELVLI